MIHSMMKAAFGILLILLCQQMNAQTITGKVTDERKQPLDAALVWLVTPTNNQTVAQAITNADGSFSLPCIDKEVKLIVTCLGYSSYTSEAFQADMPKDWGTVTLAEESRLLDDVVIVGEKARPIVEQKAGKLIFNVENSINAQGSNAFEVLRQTPGVTIDDGTKTITLNGRGNILVMLNGKQTYMQQAEVVDLLKSTPSSGIRHIEVMSNATAQYDAAGSGGILNIVLKKERAAGYNMTLNTGLSYWMNLKHNTEFSFNYNHNKMNLYGNYNHAFGHTGLFYGSTRKQSGKEFRTHSDDTDKRNIMAASLGLDYELSAHHRVGIQASGNFLFGPGWIRTFNDVYEDDRFLYSAYSESNYDRQVANRYNLNANYCYELPEERSLTVNLDYGWFCGDSRISQPNTYYSPEGKVDSVLNYASSGNRDIHLYALTAGYRQKLWRGELLTGAKYSHVTSGNAYNLFDTTRGDAVIDKEASNDFHYTEAILAGYLQYDANLSDKWQVNVGLRMEYTRSKGHLLPLSGSSQQENEVKRDYVDFFPSAGITYNLNEDNAFSLSYGRRIDRPVYSDLNPIDQPLDGFSSWKGNPFLEPQKTNRVSLQFRHKKTSAELSYSVTTDYRVSITDTLGTDKTVTIPRNLGKQAYYGLALSQALRLFRVCDVYFSGRAYHLDNRMAFDETRFYHRKRWAYGVSLQASFPLVWGIRSEVLGIYSSKRLGGSTEVMGNNGLVNIGFQKTFLKDRASVKLSLSDVFWTNNWDSVNRFDGFESVGYGYGETRLVKLNFTFKFGKNKNHYGKESQVESEMNRF